MEGRTAHNAALASLVKDVLAQADLPPAKLDRIAVITGPGSFAGLRIGVAFARGLGLAVDRDVVGVSRHESSVEMLDSSPPVLVIAPARRRPPDRSWWVQTVGAGNIGDELREVEDAGLAQACVAAGPASGTRLASFDPAAVMRCLKDAGRDDLGALTIDVATPSAARAARIAAATRYPSSRPPMPLYGRPPDATPSPVIASSSIS